MPKVKVNEIEIYYEVHGEGSPLVFLHGFAGSCKSWKEYIPHFKEDFQAITVSMRGHGKSTNPTNKSTGITLFELSDIFDTLTLLIIY